LSVVLGLVRAHGGAITVESQLGLGATFRLFFPPKAEEVLQTPKEEALISEMIEGAGLVLVVDDEPMIRCISQVQLERLGYEVITACDGVEAMEQFRTRKDEFRFVLLDLSMPRMGGWETLAALRALRSDIPVVLASGYDEAQVMHDEHLERPQAFLHKPYEMKDLKMALSAAQKAPPGTNKVA
jgi:two-component system cell cycle sensor histidine kinase/response regulator CckA